MTGSLFDRYPDALRKNAAPALLSLIWLSGLFIGSRFAERSGSDFVSLMRAAPSAGVSIVGLLPVLFLPFLFAAFAVFLLQRWLLYPICFCKAYAFGFVATSVAISYGSAGLLVCCLLLFSDICLMPLLVWLCLRHIRRSTNYLRRDLVICSVCIVAVGCTDCFVISPFLRAVIH